MRHARPDYERFQDPAGLIPEDEPVFLIRAQDQNAPFVLDYYANLANINGASAEIVELVRGHAQAMRDWQSEHGRKVPDL